LISSFDALCCGLQPLVPRHLHDGFDQRRTSIFMKLINEHFVNLDAIDIQIEELPERGSPDSEVIDGEPDACIPQ
jgi:hypothetical protein